MRQWIRSHLTYANAMVTILAFVVLGGGTAIAKVLVSSNSQIAPETVSGHQPPSGDHANIVGGSVNAADLSFGAVTNANLAGNAVSGPNVVNDGLTGADVDESTLAKVPNADTLDGIDSSDLAQGGGTTLLANRLVLSPPQDETLLVIPGLGELQAECIDDGGGIAWQNTTSSNVDLWAERSDGVVFAKVEEPGHVQGGLMGGHSSTLTLSLGRGSDPDQRIIATVHGVVLQPAEGEPCDIQAQVTRWTSP